MCVSCAVLWQRRNLATNSNCTVCNTAPPVPSKYSGPVKNDYTGVHAKLSALRSCKCTKCMVHGKFVREIAGHVCTWSCSARPPPATILALSSEGERLAIRYSCVPSGPLLKWELICTSHLTTAFKPQGGWHVGRSLIDSHMQAHKQRVESAKGEPARPSPAPAAQLTATCLFIPHPPTHTPFTVVQLVWTHLHPKQWWNPQ